MLFSAFQYKFVAHISCCCLSCAPSRYLYLHVFSVPMRQRPRAVVSLALVTPQVFSTPALVLLLSLVLTADPTAQPSAVPSLTNSHLPRHHRPILISSRAALLLSSCSSYSRSFVSCNRDACSCNRGACSWIRGACRVRRDAR